MATQPKAKPNHYVNNKQLYEMIIKYKSDCIIAKKKKKEKPQIPGPIAVCLMAIAEGLSHKHQFINYTFRDEMISDGIENCVSYFDNFDPAKSENPFAYFTQIIYYAFLRRILKERKQTYIKHKVTESSMIFDELVEQSNNEDPHNTTQHLVSDQHTVDFIKAFEDTLREKKLKNKRAKAKKGVEKFTDD